MTFAFVSKGRLWIEMFSIWIGKLILMSISYYSSSICRSLFLNDENEPGCYFNTINYDLGFTEWKPATYETTKPEYLTVTV